MNQHFEVLKFFDASIDQNLINKFKTNNNSFFCRPLQLSCLLKRAEEVEALLKLKSYQRSNTQDNQGNVWDDLDLLLMGYDGLYDGDLSETEKNQVKIIKLLIDNGWDYSKIMKRLNDCKPRLYFNLLSDVEKKLVYVLSEKKLLQKVINKTKTLPQNSSLLWKQGNTNQEINPDNVSKFLKNSIISLLSKNTLSDRKILSSLRAKLEKLLAMDFSNYVNSSEPLSEVKCQRLGHLLQTIEEASSDVGKKLFKSDFNTHEPPKISLKFKRGIKRKKTDNNGDNDKGSKRQKTQK